MAINPDVVMEDLAYADPEGAADLWGEDASDMLEDDYADDFSEDDTEDFGDDFEDDFGDDFEDDFEDSIAATVGNILGAEDEDEFLGKLARGAWKLAKKAAPHVGKIARLAAPALSAIPHPGAQAAAKVAGLLGKLRAEGATIEDALEAVAEVAARDPRALPVVAGLAARSVVRNRAASMPAAQRQNAAKTMTRAATTLVRQGGPQAIRALPKITKSVKRTTASSGTPAAARPRVVARTAAKVAQNPAMLRRLSAPSPVGQALVRRANGGGGGGGVRTIRLPGPATIRISVG
jgi:hypothetical protein